jgi:hypothetical protein
VFFDLAGVKYDYEPEGFDLDGQWYLPDFWLPTLRLWFEVKAEHPDSNYLEMLDKLRQFTGHKVVYAVGAPQADEAIFYPPAPGEPSSPSDRGAGYFFASDRRDPSVFWMTSEHEAHPLMEGASDRWPIISDRLRGAYVASRSERFDREAVAHGKN